LTEKNDGCGQRCAISLRNVKHVNHFEPDALGLAFMGQEMLESLIEEAELQIEEVKRRVIQ
jgi:hypothetical protein